MDAIPTLDVPRAAATAEAPVAPVAAAASLAPLYLHLPVTDPETVGALQEVDDGRERQDLALTAMRIGILSLKAARGTVDGTLVRHEGERLLRVLEERFDRHRDLLDESLASTLKNYFDPHSGVFNERVARLLRQDGELATVIGQQVVQARQTLDAVLGEHLGEGSPMRVLLSPDEGNAFIAAVREQTRAVVEQQAAAIVGEFSLDQPGSALSRLVREISVRHGNLERSLGDRVAAVVDEFSLDKKDSALSRLVGRVENAQRQISAQFSLDNPDSGLTRIVQRIERFERAQTDSAREFETRVTALLEKLITRREEARRSTLHGSEFEAKVGEHLRSLCIGADAVFDAVGDTVGKLPRCKVGDFVVTLGPDSAAAGAAIVVEAKARDGYTIRTTLAEADEARRNRAASVCLFVHAARTAPAGMPELHRWGHDVVVVWDEDEPATDVRLKAAWLIATALAIRAGQHDEDEAASLAEVDAAIEAIRKQVAGFEEIRTSARTIVNGGEKILKRAELMGQEIEHRVLILQQQLERLRAVARKG